MVVARVLYGRKTCRHVKREGNIQSIRRVFGMGEITGGWLRSRIFHRSGGFFIDLLPNLIFSNQEKKFSKQLDFIEYT